MRTFDDDDLGFRAPHVRTYDGPSAGSIGVSLGPGTPQKEVWCIKRLRESEGSGTDRRQVHP